MSDSLKILIVEDEPAIREGLVDVLVYHGYDVDVASDGPTGLEKALGGTFDLILLDIMLPGIDGYEICNRVRESDRHQAIIMLTAKSSDEEIIQGLKLGADDYVAKPFSVQQLVLRINAVVRRTSAGQRQQRTLVLDNMTIDTEALIGSSARGQTKFTRREMDVLCYLARNADRPVPREELLAKVWGYGKNLDIETRTVDIHIAKLRRKIERDPKHPANLLTVRGAGYQLATVS